MSLKPFKIKFSPSLLSKAKFTYSTFSDMAKCMFATARPKEDPSFVEQIQRTNTSSRAHLTARSPLSLSQSLSGVTKQEERPMPQHEPNPFHFMAPLSTIKPSSCQYQHGLLKGWRQTLDLTKDWDLQDRNGAPDQKTISERLMNLMHKQKKCESIGLKDSIQDFEDRMGCSSISRVNIQQSQPRKNSRLEEGRKKKHSLAKKVGPPETLKPCIQESQSRPYSSDSATYLVTSRFLKKSSSYSRLQAAPRSTITCNMPRPTNAFSTTPLSVSTKEQCIMNTVRPKYQKAPKQKLPLPVNIVRSDIPPLKTRLSEKVLPLQKARDSQVELSEKEHKSRVGNCLAWIRRKLP